MDNSTVTLLLGLTLGLAVVGLAISLLILTKSTAPAILATPSSYSNEERWTVIKDSDGRVKNVIVHREAKGQV